MSGFDTTYLGDMEDDEYDSPEPPPRPLTGAHAVSVFRNFVYHMSDACMPHRPSGI